MFRSSCLAKDTEKNDVKIAWRNCKFGINVLGSSFMVFQIGYSDQSLVLRCFDCYSSEEHFIQLDVKDIFSVDSLTRMNQQSLIAFANNLLNQIN